MSSEAKINGTIREGQILASTSINISESDIPVPKQGHEVDTRYKELHRRYGVVPWYDVANEFSLILAYLAETSITHRSCIEAIAQWGVGDGYVVNPGKRNIVATFKGDDPDISIPDSDRDDITAFLENANKEQNWLEIAEEAYVSWGIFGNVFVEIVRGTVGGERTFKTYVHDTTHCLLTDEVEGVRYVRISADWEDDEYLRQYPPEKVPLYPKWERDEKGLERTIIHWKNKAPRRGLYGIPTSVASILEQQIEHEIPLFNKDSFDNGFFPSAVVTFFAPNGMTKSKAKAFIDKFNDTFTGKGKKKKVFAQVVDSETMKHDVTKMDEKVDGDFLELDKRIEKKIIRAHKWYEILLGNPSSGKLGEAKEIRNAAELAYGTVIKPLQNKFISKVLDVVFKEWSEWMSKPLYDKYYFGVSSPIPVSFTGDVDINAALKVDEARQLLGYEELEDKEKGSRHLNEIRRNDNK